MTSTPARLIPPSYLLTFSLPVYYRSKLWAKGLELEEGYRLPAFMLLDRPQLGRSKLLAEAEQAAEKAMLVAETLADQDPAAEMASDAAGNGQRKAKSAGKTKVAQKPEHAGSSGSNAAPDTTSPDNASVEPTAAALQGGPLETRVAWSEEGLTFQFSLEGKTRRPYCRLNDLEHSDAIEIFLDTRNTKSVHRATRFCHRFLFLPCGAGPHEKDPYASMLKIHLARGEPSTMGMFQPHVNCKIHAHGYKLTCHLSRKFLEGWAPVEQPEVGIFYQVRDSELGHFSMVYDRQLPVSEDPSLWPTAFLTKQSAT